MDKATAKIRMEKYKKKTENFERWKPFINLIPAFYVMFLGCSLILLYFDFIIVDNGFYVEHVELNSDDLLPKQVVGMVLGLLNIVLVIFQIILFISNSIHWKKYHQAVSLYCQGSDEN